MVENFRFDHHRRKNIVGSDESDESWQSDFTQEEDELSDSDIEPTEDEKKNHSRGDSRKGHGHHHGGGNATEGGDKKPNVHNTKGGGIKILKRKEPRIAEGSNEDPQPSTRKPRGGNRRDRESTTEDQQAPRKSNRKERQKRKDRAAANEDSTAIETENDPSSAKKSRRGPNAKANNKRNKNDDELDHKKSSGETAGRGGKEKYRPKYVPKSELMEGGCVENDGENEEKKRQQGGDYVSKKERNRGNKKNRKEFEGEEVADDKKWKKKKNRGKDVGGDDEGGKGLEIQLQQKKWRPKGEGVGATSGGGEAPRWRVKGENAEENVGGGGGQQEDTKTEAKKEDVRGKESYRERKKAEKWEKRQERIAKKWEPVKERNDENDGSYNKKAKAFVPKRIKNDKSSKTFHEKAKQGFSVEAKQFVPNYTTSGVHMENQVAVDQYGVQYIEGIGDQGYAIEREDGTYIAYEDPQMATVAMDPTWQGDPSLGMGAVGYDDYSSNIWQYDPATAGVSDIRDVYATSGGGIVEAIATSDMANLETAAASAGGFSVKSPSFNPHVIQPGESSKFVDVSGNEAGNEKFNLQSHEFLPKSKNEFA